MKITCVGTGDAFGSGGRLNSCYHLQTPAGGQLLIDCGSTSLIGLARCGINPAAIDTVVISHLHGDHFGGIPYLLLDGKYLSKRTRPLTVIGPRGLEQRVETVANALYAGLSASSLNFPVSYQILDDGAPFPLHGLEITPRAVQHGGTPYAYGFRVAAGKKVFAYSGDTEWTPALVSLAQGCDLLITECFAYDQPVAGHLDYRTLLEKRSQLDCRRLALTHLGPAMLHRCDALEFETLSDGDLLPL